MSSTKQVVSNAFESSASDRLTTFLRAHGLNPTSVVPLTPDASTRSYFRVPWSRGHAVAAVYPEPFDPQFHPYLDTTRLFASSNIPVPEIYEVDGPSGIILQEDLGTRQLINEYETAPDDEREHHKEAAIRLIAQIQKATDNAKQLESIASRLAFDEAKQSSVQLNNQIYVKLISFLSTILRVCEKKSCVMRRQQS